MYISVSICAINFSTYHSKITFCANRNFRREHSLVLTPFFLKIKYGIFFDLIESVKFYFVKSDKQLPLWKKIDSIDRRIPDFYLRRKHMKLGNVQKIYPIPKVYSLTKNHLRTVLQSVDFFHKGLIANRNQKIENFSSDVQFSIANLTVSLFAATVT